MAKTTSLLNEVTTREFIFNQVEQGRNTVCTCVPNEVLDGYESWVEAQICEYARDLCLLNLNAEILGWPRMLRWNMVRARLLTLVQEQVNWLDIKGVKTFVILHLEHRLRYRILEDVEGCSVTSDLTFRPAPRS